VDWNSDGKADLISGDRNGYFNVWVWRDTGFEAHTQYLKTDSTAINVGYNSYPAVLDWNGDGKKDLLLGCENGQVLLWSNVGSDTWPMFQAAETVDAGGVPLYQYRVNPFVFDLDRDGVNDLACGDGNGYVLFYRNTGTNVAPELAAAETLKTPRGQPVMSGGTVYGARCWFGYWDADSLPDILLSAYDGNVELFHGALPVGVDEANRMPMPFALRVGPNPTTGRSVTIRYTLDATGSTLLQVHDLTGRVVRTLCASSMQPGAYGVVWDGRNDAGAELNSGVYFCRLNSPGQTASARVVISR
jgi:hypothetical protein